MLFNNPPIKKPVRWRHAVFPQWCRRSCWLVAQQHQMASLGAFSFALRLLAKHAKDSTAVRRTITSYRTVQPGRLFSAVSASTEGQLSPKAKTVSITFNDRDGDKKTVQAKHGELLLDVAKNNDIDVEGACEGTLSCSTCHLIFDPEEYSKLDLDPPSDEENDMLDLAYGLTDTSRLGCQIEVTDKLDGITLKVPEATRDIRE